MLEREGGRVDADVRLARVVFRYAEQKGFGVRVVEMSPGEGFGIKSAMLEIEGENAFGLLSAEKGRKKGMYCSCG